MVAKLMYTGKVAIVTGAGGGLGRTYAIELGKRGASVVVNDLGGSRHGEGKTSAMADSVVNEIKAAGGKAVANYDSVENGAAIVKTAVDNFGRVDIVINNAGILRDKAFVNMTDGDWDLIFAVHMRGAYAVTKAAWPYMRKNKYGRVIVTSSNSAIYGSFGQANYSAAKLGLVGFAKSLALEGAKYNIKVNALVPTAGSRMTETVMPQEVVESLKPDYVTPMTLYLAHEECPKTGAILEAGGGWFGEVQMYRSEGRVLNGLNTTIEDVRDNWEAITDMSKAKNFKNSAEASAIVMQAMSEASEKSSSAPATTNSAAGNLPSTQVFKEMAKQVDAALVKKVNGVFLWVITQNGKELAKWTVDLKNGSGSVHQGDPKVGKANTTLTLTEPDLIKLVEGKLNPQQAFMTGKLKIKGNIMLTQKLQTLFAAKAKM